MFRGVATHDMMQHDTARWKKRAVRSDIGVDPIVPLVPWGHHLVNASSRGLSRFPILDTVRGRLGAHEHRLDQQDQRGGGEWRGTRPGAEPPALQSRPTRAVCLVLGQHRG